MIWPPVKAWTSKCYIDGQVHFVAINYGGKLLGRWVLLMSVIDSSIVIKVSWPQLIDPSFWECGWDERGASASSKLINNKVEKRTIKLIQPSSDSGLTIPKTNGSIRSWFEKS